MTYAHTPVLLHQAIQALQVQPNLWYADATLGGGGYTVELLRRGAQVVGIDTDKEAIAAARENIQTVLPEKKDQEHFILVQNNFRYIQEIVQEKQLEIQGIVADLGISSYQLDTPERGFSYRFDKSLLDMRLNQTEGVTAADIIHQYSEEHLYEIFATYGEEERARAIAIAIVRARKVTPITTTGQLFALIEQVVSGHVYETASRIFQAIRMEVNDELGSLKNLLDQAEKILPKGGRLAIVTFHSLEDRTVKLAMRKPCWQIVTKQAIIADEQEVHNNSRARSAKLRVAEKKVL